MRKGNVTILASIFTMLLVAMGVGAGTMAYFSDVETAEIGQVYAATLDMQISKGSGWTDDVIHISSDDLTPGDTFTIEIWLKNVGTTDIQYIFASFRNLDYGDGNAPESEWDESVEGRYLTKMILLDGIYEEAPNLLDPGYLYNDFTGNMDAWLTFWGAPQDGSISLYDLAVYCEPGGDSALTSFRFHTGDQGTPPRHTIVPYLPIGGVAHIKFDFRLDEDTLNYAQGDYFSFDLVFIGSNLMTPDPSL